MYTTSIMRLIGYLFFDKNRKRQRNFLLQFMMAGLFLSLRHNGGVRRVLASSSAAALSYRRHYRPCCFQNWHPSSFISSSQKIQRNHRLQEISRLSTTTTDRTRTRTILMMNGKKKHKHSTSKSGSDDDKQVKDEEYYDISSTKSNKTVKQFQTLIKKSKHRMQLRQTIVEGPKIITELLQNPTTKHLLRHVLVCKSEISDDNDKDDNNTILSFLDRKYQEQDNDDDDHQAFRLSYVTPQVLKACTDTVTPQGIVAIVDIPPSFELIHDDDEDDDGGGDSITEFKSSSQLDNNNNDHNHKNEKYPLYLVLDGVSDPGNVGTLLRSSLAVGVSGIILLPECCDVWNPKAIRSAMGSTFYLPRIIQVPSWEIAKLWLKQVANVQHIYAATMLEETEDNGGEGGGGGGKGDSSQTTRTISQAHFNVDWKSNSPCALVIGSEGKGLNEDIRRELQKGSGSSSSSNDNDHHDEKILLQAVHVPMIENSMESLNAAVCGSVILFDYLRQKMS